MQVWLWIYCAMRAEKSIDTLFILRTDKRFKDWKENSRCGRQSFSLASLDSSLYTREPDPSVGCADSSPDKGSQWAVGDAGPYGGDGGAVDRLPLSQPAADSSPDKGSLCGARWFCLRDPSPLRVPAPLTRGASAGDRKGRPYGPDKGSQTPHPTLRGTFPSRGRLWGMEQSQYTFFLREV